VWKAVVRVLRAPDLLLQKVRQHRHGVDARRVEVRSELADFRVQLKHLQDRRRRLLDIYADGRLEKALFIERDGAATIEQEALEKRLAHAERLAAKGLAESAQREAVLRYCALVGKGLDSLDPLPAALYLGADDCLAVGEGRRGSPRPQAERCAVSAGRGHPPSERRADKNFERGFAKV